MISARQFSLLALIAATGCSKNEDPERLLDTGWFVDTAALSPEECRHQVVSTEPAANETGWYWQAAPRVFTDSVKQDAYDAYLIDQDGVRLDSTMVWGPEGLSFELDVPGGLAANTDYTLNVVDCRQLTEVPFRTSAYGEALEGEPGDLVGRTYVLDLVNGNWVEPGGVGPLLALYFTTPVLIGVQYADASIIDFIGAPGTNDVSGDLVQDLEASSWYFPAAPFEQAPLFVAAADSVTFEFQGTVVPVTDFTFSGTISSDMDALGGGVLTGLGDTRNMGGLLNDAGNPSAVCDSASRLGVDCADCPDGEPYCLFIRVTDVEGDLVPGLTLQER